MRTSTVLAVILLLVVVGIAFVGARTRRAVLAVPLASAPPSDRPARASAPAPSSEPLAQSSAADERTLAADDVPIAATSAHPLRGRVVDERTGEPVPAMAFVVVRAGDDSGEELVTDSEGRFRTRAPLEPGDFMLGWHDPDAETSPYEASEIALDSLELERELRVQVGPTYLLDLRAPASLSASELLATLSSSLQREIALRQTSDFAPVRDIRVWNPPAPWVRFHPSQVFGAESEGPWFLDVVSKDGVWCGGAEVRSIVGRYPELVTLELFERSSLRGTVRDERGEPVVHAWLELEREVAGARHRMWSLANGEYQIRALEPGRWRLEVSSYEHATRVAMVELQAGRESVQDVTLVLLEPAGSVRGVVTSATGAWRGQGEVALWGHEGTKSNRRSPLAWTEESGRWVHRFAFEDVPAGTYELHWVSRDCPFAVQPTSVQLVSVPAPDLEIRILDDVPTGRVVFRAREAASGEELPSFDVWWMPPDGWAGWKQGVAPGTAVIERWPVDRELFWSLRAPSGAMVVGDSSSFVRAGEELVANVAVVPGWGAQFFVMDEGGKYLPDTRFAFDGVEFTASGRYARLCVSLPRPPRKVEVLTPGWTIARGDIDPATGECDESQWWAMSIVLKPAER